MVRSPALPDEPVIERLTVREREVLRLLAQHDLDHRDIAAQLYLAPNSVKWYTRQIYAKLGVNDRRQAVKLAKAHGLLDEPTAVIQHNLPAALTPFFGHQDDLAAIRQYLGNPAIRLITLTGTGGVGKTRLAIQAACICQDLYPAGVWLVELASIRDSNLIVERIAASLEQIGTKSHDLQALKNFLKNKKILLVLDNCEHVIDACARLADFLLSSCPNLQIIATSREKLGLTGEVVLKVPSFVCPDPTAHLQLEELENYDAVSFFVRRAKEVQPAFKLTEEGIQSIATICRKLDGIPLALELAAARLSTLDIDQIASYLRESFDILSNASRVALPRHQTMHASIEWSYRLLSGAEQKMLKCLSIFAGGWTLEAASAVCLHEMGETQSDLTMVTRLELLVEKSLVAAEIKSTRRPNAETRPARQTRYTLLEPIRQYVDVKLVEDGEKPDAIKRHAAYFLRLASQAEPNLRGADQRAWLIRLEEELDNLRMALSYLLINEVTSELRLASALLWFWHNRGRWEEGLTWLSRGLQRARQTEEFPNGDNPHSAPGNNSSIYAKALAAAGYMQGKIPANQEDVKELEKASDMLKESLALYKKQRPQDSRGMASVLHQLVCYANESVRPAQVLSWANQSLALNQEEGDHFGLSECLSMSGCVERNTSRAAQALQESLKLKKKIGDIDGIGHLNEYLGDLDNLKGEYELANHHFLESLENFRKVDNRFRIARCLDKLAWLDWIKGETARAIEKIQEALALSLEMEPHRYAALLLLRAKIQLASGQLREAAQDVHIALELGDSIPSRLTKVSALSVQARLAWLSGDARTAISHLDKAMALTREIRGPLIKAEVLYYLGRINMLHGGVTTATSYLKESLKKYTGLLLWIDKFNIAYPLGGLAGLAILQGDAVRAAKLFGASNRRFPLLAATLAPFELQWREKEMEQARQTLGDAVYAQHWQEGWELSLDHAVAFALGQP